MHNREALHQKVGKANFDLVYDLEDPREYFNTLRKFDYCIPQHGQRLFSELIEARREASRDGDRAKRFRVVDVCCSYGINGTLLKYETTLEEMYARYGSRELAGLSSEELAEDDAAYYGARCREAAPEVVGLDVAQNAVSYGLLSGILDEDEPTEALGGAVAGADLLTVTGGIGYVTERTFERLLRCMAEGSDGRMPWVAAFALRWVSYDRISEVLSDYGLVTEKLADRTFAQRRFADEAEREYVLEELVKAGVDTNGKEDTGWYHANFYLSRPAKEAKTPPEALLRRSWPVCLGGGG